MKKKLLRLLGGVPKHELEYFHKNVDKMTDRIIQLERDNFTLKRDNKAQQEMISKLSKGLANKVRRNPGRPKGSKNKKKDPRLNYSK